MKINQFSNPIKRIKVSEKFNEKLTRFKYTALFLSLFFIAAHGPPNYFKCLLICK